MPNPSVGCRISGENRYGVQSISRRRQLCTIAARRGRRPLIPTGCQALIGPRCFVLCHIARRHAGPRCSRFRKHVQHSQAVVTGRERWRPLGCSRPKCHGRLSGPPRLHYLAHSKVLGWATRANDRLVAGSNSICISESERLISACKRHVEMRRCSMLDARCCQEWACANTRF